MTDRNPGAPGQNKAVVTQDEFRKLQAGEQFIITLTRDDQPIVDGTPYSKETVLPDELAQNICPDVLDPTPADAFRSLSSNGYGGKSPEIVVTDDSDGRQFESEADSFLSKMKDNSVKQAIISDKPFIDENYYVSTIYKFSASHAVIDAVSYNGIHIRKLKQNGTWQPFEYENPPMVIGNEYRTTERWQGKAVYTKLINFGQMPYNNISAVFHGATATKVIRCIGQRSKGETLPFSYNDITIGIYADNSKVWINTRGMTSSFSDTATAQIWYTKD